MDGDQVVISATITMNDLHSPLELLEAMKRVNGYELRGFKIEISMMGEGALEK
jgi:hypothetical protein